MSNGRDDCKAIWPCAFCDSEEASAEFVDAVEAAVQEWAEGCRRGNKTSLWDCLQKLAKRFPDPKE